MEQPPRSTPGQSPDQQTGGPTHNFNAPTDGQDGFPAGDAQRDAGQTGDQEHRRHERKHWRVQNTIATMGLILAFVAAGGGIASSIYASRALIASQEAVAQARRAADEAHRQADAAESQTRVSSDALYSIQRAYIAPLAPASIGPPENPQTIGVSYVNQGVSAANNVIVEGKVSIEKIGDPLFDPAKQQFPSVPSLGFSLLPHESKGFFFKVEALKQEEIKSLRDGNFALLVYGAISYDDVFKLHHVSHFCSRYIFDSSAGPSLLNGICNGWNDAD